MVMLKKQPTCTLQQFHATAPLNNNYYYCMRWGRFVLRMCISRFYRIGVAYALPRQCIAKPYTTPGTVTIPVLFSNVDLNVSVEKYVPVTRWNAADSIRWIMACYYIYCTFTMLSVDCLIYYVIVRLSQSAIRSKKERRDVSNARAIVLPNVKYVSSVTWMNWVRWYGEFPSKQPDNQQVMYCPSIHRLSHQSTDWCGKKIKDFNAFTSRCNCSTDNCI